MPSNMWDETTYTFPNFNGTTIEVWEWATSTWLLRGQNSSQLSEFTEEIQLSLSSVYRRSKELSNFKENLIRMSSAKWWPFCWDLNMLKFCSWNRNIPRQEGEYNGCWCPGSLCQQVSRNHGNVCRVNRCLSSTRKDFNYLCDPRGAISMLRCDRNI